MTEAQTGHRTVPDGDEAEAERGRPNRWKVVFVTLLVVGALGAVTWVLLGSRLLVVRHVEVSGTELAPRDRVVAAAGIDLGTPMARLRTGAVRERVERLREVESAKIERHWPGTVRIVVREREPVAVFDRNGRYQLLDRHGVTVADAESRPAGLPALTVASPGPSDKATLAALTVLAALPERLSGKLAEVEATGPEAVTLHMQGGQTVVWGAAERAGEKIRLLDALRRTAGGRAVRTVDISSPEVLKTS
ncbi:FtsQ-type POTRA domain-containing protein [Actinomadura darangshiensis]|uniref:FtsQ-type POTRA domain-containing protein n=1 Tax=Actinomadura darangshiensis TaxID=705336 RepID=A0A4R5B6L4_9ACTN|nr:FtsQ-type POTRA domain-containing protein [Actinomadura darangshiensis]TDD80056.1 FtsQ-type POTRA domain-containing protein [Actinomadura darangshiensis]